MAIMRVVNPSSMGEIYRLAFDQICNREDWKGPIQCRVPKRLASLYINAIVFMTGTNPDECDGPDDTVELRSVGYRMGPCGDH